MVAVGLVRVRDPRTVVDEVADAVVVVIVTHVPEPVGGQVGLIVVDVEGAVVEAAPMQVAIGVRITDRAHQREDPPCEARRAARTVACHSPATGAVTLKSVAWGPEIVHCDSCSAALLPAAAATGTLKDALAPESVVGKVNVAGGMV